MNISYGVKRTLRILLACVIGIMFCFTENHVSAEPPYAPKEDVYATTDALCELYETLAIEPADPDLCANGEPTQRTIFVTINEYAPQIHFTSVEEADRVCQTEANEEGLPGRFKAWISGTSMISSPYYRFEHSTAPYVRPDGVVVAENWADLTTGSLQAPIVVYANGAELPPDDWDNVIYSKVWTNTYPTSLPISTERDRVCNNWTENDFDAGMAATGYPWYYEDSRWSGVAPDTGELSLFACSPQTMIPSWTGKARLYCVQQAN